MEPGKTLNLLGEICPMTWVRTKLALEAMGSGELLEVWLDEGEPATSVPQSAARAQPRTVFPTPVPVPVKKMAGSAMGRTFPKREKEPRWSPAKR